MEGQFGAPAFFFWREVFMLFGRRRERGQEDEEDKEDEEDAAAAAPCSCETKESKPGESVTRRRIPAELDRKRRHWTASVAATQPGTASQAKAQGGLIL